MDKHQYDGPDDPETTKGRALMFALIAVIVIVVFVLIYTSY